MDPVSLTSWLAIRVRIENQPRAIKYPYLLTDVYFKMPLQQFPFQVAFGVSVLTGVNGVITFSNLAVLKIIVFKWIQYL